MSAIEIFRQPESGLGSGGPYRNSVFHAATSEQASFYAFWGSQSVSAAASQ